MNKARYELFVKKLNFSNHPKSYKGHKILDKIAARKTYMMLFTLHDNGINMDKFIEYNLLDIDAQWRYNVVMSAVKDGLFKVKDVKHIIAIDDFITGMVQEHQSLRGKYEGRMYVFQQEEIDVDKYVKGVVVSAMSAMAQEKLESGKEFKSYLNTFECVIANESGVYTEEEVEIAIELKAERDAAIKAGMQEESDNSML